jgi:hypothetical protein
MLVRRGANLELLRMALGAGKRDVVVMIVRESLIPVSCPRPAP